MLVSGRRALPLSSKEKIGKHWLLVLVLACLLNLPRASSLFSEHVDEYSCNSIIASRVILGILPDDIYQHQYRRIVLCFSVFIVRSILLITFTFTLCALLKVGKKCLFHPNLCASYRWRPSRLLCSSCLACEGTDTLILEADKFRRLKLSL